MITNKTKVRQPKSGGVIMPAQCYICADESHPRFCCTNCGGFFCEDHGTRSDKRCICDNCIAHTTKTNAIKAQESVEFLVDTKSYLERKKEIYISMGRAKSEEAAALIKLIDETLSILGITS